MRQSLAKSHLSVNGLCGVDCHQWHVSDCQMPALHSQEHVRFWLKHLYTKNAFKRMQKAAIFDLT